MDVSQNEPIASCGKGSERATQKQRLKKSVWWTQNRWEGGHSLPQKKSFRTLASSASTMLCEKRQAAPPSGVVTRCKVSGRRRRGRAGSRARRGREVRHDHS